MPTVVQRDDVQRLVARGAQLVEVLPSEEYAHEHLPGAISMPLERFTRETIEHNLLKERPVIVYCQSVE
jgi:rhodanese-related sulfurtransferase